jgi:sulfonate transport system ATP-binding protein
MSAWQMNPGPFGVHHDAAQSRSARQLLPSHNPVVTRLIPVQTVQRPVTLHLEGVRKSYSLRDGLLQALESFDLDVSFGEFVCIVGASGCGKSTLLRLIAGLESDYEGRIVYQGKDVRHPDLSRGIVFQEHRLLPWLTVQQNVAIALSAVKATAAEKRSRVAEQIASVGLEAFANAYPHQLSGGMAQRVAIARALVVRPQLLLLDEPFGALDALTRLKMQKELQRLWERDGLTTILVTHDVEEAVFLGDRVVVMSSSPGRIKRVVPVPLSRPRVRSTPEFQRIKESVLEDFADVRE